MPETDFRALIVDPDFSLRIAAAQALAAYGFTCDVATDGRDALGKFHLQRHDLVVTELRMPGMHGYALALELLRAAAPPRIVVLTEVVEPSLIKDLYSRGVDDVITKPIDLRVFAAKVASLLLKQQWRESLLETQHSLQPATGHTLIAEIEHTLAASSQRAPARFEELFQAALITSEPPQGMVSYLERQCEGVDDDDDDRRHNARASLLATVLAIPLSKTLEPCGDPFKAAARDASTGGLSLLHTRAVTAGHLALRWQSLASPGRQIDLVMRVHRCQPMGPFYEVAGEFVSQGSSGCEEMLSHDAGN
jgi:DNA-binding response OmpR family regulator